MSQRAILRRESCPVHGWFARGDGPCVCQQIVVVPGQEALFAETARLSGERLKQEGAAAALAAAEAEWRAKAESKIEFYCLAGIEFTAEDIRLAIGDPPHHKNALGGLFISAARRGLIRSLGYENATRKSAHARPIRVWVGT